VVDAATNAYDSPLLNRPWPGDYTIPHRRQVGATTGASNNSNENDAV